MQVLKEHEFKNQFIKIFHYIFILLATGGLIACGGGSNNTVTQETSKNSTTNVNSELGENSVGNTNISPTPSIEDTSPINNAETSGLSNYDPDYCADFTVAPSSIVGNIYTFDTFGNDCFGIVGDGAQRKTVPLRLRDNATTDENIRIGNTVSLYNSTPEVGQFRRLMFTFDVSNITSSPICFIDFDDMSTSLFDENDQEVALLTSTSYLDGALYELSSLISTDTCLMPGQTLKFVGEVDGLPLAVVNAASYAIANPIDERTYIGDLQPNLAVTELVTEHPGLYVNFVNDSGRPISIGLGFSSVNFFDNQGYAIHSGFLSLDGDNDIIESGDSFSLSSSYLFNENIWPSKASKAVIHLDWEYYD